MKKIFLSFFLILTIFLFATKKIKADTGPKPDMEIIITSLEKSDYIVAYATRYSPYFGPHKAFNPYDTSEHHLNETNFGDFSDLKLIYDNVNLPNGWYLSDISSFHKNTSELVIKSGYMWPDEFILIIYNKTTNKYFLSSETKTYAFHSYFKCDLKNYESLDLIELEKVVTLEKNYNYTKEIIEFLIRLLLTLAIELLLALIFKLDKKLFLVILITNIITQILLNVGLNITAYLSGKMIFLLLPYFLFEFIIIILETLIYLYFVKNKENKIKLIIPYTICANVLLDLSKFFGHFFIESHP